MDLALNPANTQFFGTLDLETVLVPGVTLAVGIRNSMDKSFPMGWAAWNRCTVCDNLAMRSEIMVKRKHSRYGTRRFQNAISQAVTSLHSFQETEAFRLRRMAETGITTEKAESLMLRAYLRNIISFKHLHDIEKQWREPAHEEWERGTLFHLFNAFTYVMSETGVLFG